MSIIVLNILSRRRFQFHYSFRSGHGSMSFFCRHRYHRRRHSALRSNAEHTSTLIYHIGTSFLFFLSFFTKQRGEQSFFILLFFCVCLSFSFVVVDALLVRAKSRSYFALLIFGRQSNVYLASLPCDFFFHLGIE